MRPRSVGLQDSSGIRRPLPGRSGLRCALRGPAAERMTRQWFSHNNWAGEPGQATHRLIAERLDTQVMFGSLRFIEKLREAKNACMRPFKVYTSTLPFTRNSCRVQS
jgi:hypothetical protein